MRLSKGLIRYLDSSPSPFHAVSTAAARLQEAGFTKIEAAGGLKNLVPGAKHYYHFDGSLVAFAVGGQLIPGNHAFKIMAAHTDSPTLKVKSRSRRMPTSAASSWAKQISVETYGGGLWHTFLDRDLSVAGRVIVRNEDGTLSRRLVHCQQPILRVPSLCIHLQDAAEREALHVNKEDHLQPIICDRIRESLSEEPARTFTGSGWTANQEPVLLSILGKEMGLQDVDNIADFDLVLFDTQGATLGGAHQEYIFSARLDNLASCFLTVEALCDHASGESSTSSLDEDEDVSVVALFDHEEVGSVSASGAGSPIMNDAINRITAALMEGEDKGPGPTRYGMGGLPLTSRMAESHRAALSRSLILSVDQAHAVHPNFASKHDLKGAGPTGMSAVPGYGLAPVLNGGPVIKSNGNQRYATLSSGGGFVVRELGRRALNNIENRSSKEVATLQESELQEFSVRNDCPCGSTIGPIISAATGIRAVDLGMPQLSMHSCREMMGRHDLDTTYELFCYFLKNFRTVDESLVD